MVCTEENRNDASILPITNAQGNIPKQVMLIARKWGRFASIQRIKHVYHMIGPLIG